MGLEGSPGAGSKKRADKGLHREGGQTDQLPWLASQLGQLRSPYVLAPAPTPSSEAMGPSQD